MGLDYSASGLLAISIVMIVVSVLSTALRFWSRTVVLKGEYGLDDWLALIATILSLGQLVTCPIYVANHVGSDVSSVTFDEVEAILKTFFADVLINCLALTFIKLSQLSLYVRIFGFRSNPSRFWKVSLSVTTIFALAYPVWTIPVAAAQCDPIQKTWNPLLPGHCLDFLDLCIAWSAYNIFTDFLVLLQPLPALFRLNMKAPRKIALTFAFVVGYSAPLVAVGRLVMLVVLSGSLNTNFTRAQVPVGFWLEAELGISLFAISSPPIYQLVARLVRFGPASLFNSENYEQSKKVGNIATGHTSSESHFWKKDSSGKGTSSIRNIYKISSETSIDRSKDSLEAENQFTVSYNH